MSTATQQNEDYGPWVRAMSRALEHGDGDGFRTALAGFDQARNCEVALQVRRGATELQTALDRLRVDSKLIDLAQHQVPGARHRLAHVLRLTDDAAHRTMDLVERSAPLADHATQEADRLICLQQKGSTVQQIAPQLTAFVTLVS